MNKKDIWEWSYSAEYLTDHTCGLLKTGRWDSQIWDWLADPIIDQWVEGCDVDSSVFFDSPSLS